MKLEPGWLARDVERAAKRAAEFRAEERPPMKLETSEEERAKAKRWYNKNAFSMRLARDIDTLLAEVERLRAERRPFSDGLAQKVIDEQVKTIDRLTAKLATEPPAPPLPAEVEEMRKRLEGPHEWGYRCLVEGPFFISDPAPFEAASLLSRWPGVWRPMETAPHAGSCILESAEGWVGEAWFSKDADGWWAANTHPTDAHDGQVLNPIGWMPLPAPGAAP